jgi:hypothetical protein
MNKNSPTHEPYFGHVLPRCSRLIQCETELPRHAIMLLHPNLAEGPWASFTGPTFLLAVPCGELFEINHEYVAPPSCFGSLLCSVMVQRWL